MDPIQFQPSSGVTDRVAMVDLAEVDAAIGMVVTGAARRVCLVALTGVEAIAGIALARAQAAEVGFHLDRDAGGAVRLTIGPRADTGGDTTPLPDDR
jgi:hypothetical protein